MSSNRKKLAIAALGGHIGVIIILWFLLKDDNIQEPVFEKVISVNITTKVPSLAPPLNQATRDKIEKERRQKEESAWKKQQSALKKKYEAEAKKKKEAEAEAEAEAKKAAEAKKKAETKKPPVKKKDDSKKKLEDKKKKELLKKQQELAAQKAAEAKKKRAQERAERIRREKMAAAQKAKADAERRENARRQTVLGKHVTTDIVSRLTVEWNKGTNSAIQFNDPNDFVTIQLTVSRNGSLISARVTKRAKSANLNAKAAALIATISRNGYKFPAFDKAYNKPSITLSRNFRTK